MYRKAIFCIQKGVQILILDQIPETAGDLSGQETAAINMTVIKYRLSS